MDQYNLIPNAFTVYSDCYAKIGEIGYAMSDPDVQDSARHAQLKNQLITASSLFYTVTGLINLNDDGDAIIGINADAELVNSLLLNLKDACGLNSISQFPTPFTTINFSNANPGQSYPVGGVGAILQSNGLTYLPLEMGAPGEVLTASPTGLVWSAVVGNGIPSGGTTGQVLHKVNNTSYNVAWVSLTPSDIGVSASVSELDILDGATISTDELNTLAGINTGLSIQAQLDSKASTTLNNGQFLVGNGSNVATAVTPDGDVTFNNAGVFAITAGSIVNADVNTSAAISRAKLASGTAYRILTNDNTGVMSEAGAIAANRVIVSNINGVPVHSTVTTTVLGFLDATSSVQTQLDSKLTVVLTTPAQGAMLYYNGTNWVNFAVGTAGQVLTSTGSIPQWGSATANGLPSGGTTNQYLRKIDATNYNTEWHTFELADVTDVVTTATEVNLLSGLTVAAMTLNYVDISSSLTTLLNNKQTISLPQNAIWRGNASNEAEAYPAGTEGFVLTVVGGVPTWAVTTPPGNVSGVAPSVDNAIARWNGTAADSIQNSAVIIDDSGNVTGVTTLSSGQISVLNQAAVRLYETGSTNYVALRAAGTMGSDYTITLPAAAPGTNTFLMYDGADYVWNAGGGAGTIGGTIASTQVAFGSGTDTIAGEAAFTYNSTDNILSIAGRLNTTLASDPVSTVTNGDLFYSSASGVIDYRARINGVWTNITRPGTSTKNSTYTISESERNYITLVDTSGGDVTIDISVDLSAQWCQTFINTGANDIIFTASGGMTLNAIDTTCSTQWGWVTLTRSGSNTYYAAGALGAGGGGGGTVTSVAMTLPSVLFTTPPSGSPITTSGTLAVALATQSANVVFAGPTTGGAATPTFRGLVAADIPDLSSLYIQDLQSVLDQGSTASITTAVELFTSEDIMIRTLGAGKQVELVNSDGTRSFGVSDTAIWINSNGVVYPWPSSAPASNNYVLTAQTDGTLSWAAPSSGITIGTTTITSGTNTRVLYNNSGVVGEYAQVPVSVGGTGAATLTGLLQGNGTSAFTAIANSSTVGQVLRVTGASTYAWGALDLADSDAVTGTLPVGNGGTGITSLGSGVATFLGTPSWTNFSSMITGTAPFWSLASGGALTANNTLTGAFSVTFNLSSTTSPFNVTGAYTVPAGAAINAYLSTFAGTLTGKGTSNDVIAGMNVAPTLNNSSGVGITHVGIRLFPVFGGSVTPSSSISLFVLAGNSVAGSELIRGANSSGITRFSLKADGTFAWTTTLTGSDFGGTMATNAANGTGHLLFSFQLAGSATTAHSGFGMKMTGGASTNATNYTYNSVWDNRSLVVGHTGFIGYGFRYDPVVSGAQAGTEVLYAFTSSAGLWGVGTLTPANAWMVIAAGTTALASMKFTTGTLLSAAVAGCVEYDNSFYMTQSDASRRFVVLATNATKTTAGAPYTNDAYITVRIGGTDVKLMTTA